MGAAMALPPALDALWAARPGGDGAARMLGLLFHDPALVTADVARARDAAMRAGESAFAPLFPAPRDRWVRDLTLDPRHARRRARARPARPRRERPAHADRRRRPPAARAAPRRATARVRALRPCARGRAAGGVHPRPRRLPGARCLSSPSSAAPTPSSSGRAWPARPAASPPATAGAPSSSPTRCWPRRPASTRCSARSAHAGLDAVVFGEAAIDVPMATIDAAHAAAREARPDVVVAVGGGSAIDLAKVTALLLAHGGPLSAYYGEHLVPGPDRPADRPADHRGHRLGGHAGLGDRRSRARHEGRDLEPVPDPAHGDLRPGADADVPAAR